ncbi:MAG: hypothetical protein HY900_20215 [Deltaproteobacteria bacterium]|nr:hypothetical protein [Deltaproteobacteria bacterium]
MVLRADGDGTFPGQVTELLRTLDGVGFFETSMLVGSWVMSVYGDVFGIRYPLRTLDIDFGVEFVAGGKAATADLEELLVGLSCAAILPTPLSRPLLRRRIRNLSNLCSVPKSDTKL